MTEQVLVILGNELRFTRSEVRIHACLKPGERHPGPCKGQKPLPSAAKAIRKAVAVKKAMPAKKAAAPAKKAPPRAPILTPDQAEQMQQRMLADQPWTDAQRTALHDYSDWGYVDMNARLRKVPSKTPARDQRPPEQVAEAIRGAFHALRPLPQDVRVFRMADSSKLSPDNGADGLRGRLESLVGKERQDAAFLSTTINPDPTDMVNFGDVQLDIDLPAGTRAAYIESITENPTEQEILVTPGLKLQFLSLDMSKNPPVLKAKGVPPS